MAVLNNILNLVSCGAGEVLGTGLKGCRPFFKKVSAIWLLPSGTVLDGSRELNDAYALELQAQGKLIVLRGIRGFADNTPDDTSETLDDGTLQLTSLGLYQFTLQFINGRYFNAALHSLSGYGNYDAILIDREGSILGTRAANGSIKGFTLGIVQATKMQWATDTTAERSGLMIQLLDRSEVDIDYVFIQNAMLGSDFNPNRVNGVNQIQLDYASVPVAGATTVTVKAAMRMDGKPFVGLDPTDFLVTVGTTSAQPSAAVESSPGVYALTIPAVSLNDVVSTQLYDNTNNRNIITVDMDTYKSNIATITVI